MIKRLRKKLVFTAMISLLFVLLVIEGIVGILNYRKIIVDADGILTILEENEGRFPELFHGEPEKMPRQEPEKELGIGPGGGNAEIPFESRFFSVVLDAEGTVVTTDLGKIASINTVSAIQYAERVWKSGKSQGFLEQYRYQVSADLTAGTTRIIFLDRGRELSNFHNLVMTGLVVTVIGLGAVFLLMVFLSAHITKPFVENYEKQKRFITDAGHELKTPLTIIDADAEVLEMDLGENEWLSDIQCQSRRLADLTNDLILLSRMEETRNQIVMMEFPFSDMVEEKVHAFQALAKTQNKVLVSELLPLVSAYGDARALGRLVTILLDNAVKYSPEGGTIKVCLEKTRKRISLSVWNTTESIKREQLEYLFDRFYRTDTSRNSQTGGYGLGLSIAAAIVEAHHGKISATTEDEKSLTITVSLPVKEKEPLKLN